MPLPERGDTSYVSIKLACGDTARITRTNRPRKAETIFCFTCQSRQTILEITEDLEWVVRCMECNYRARCGTQGFMKAQRYAANHFNRRKHTVKFFHENDPDGTEKTYREKTWREVATEPDHSGFPEEPPF